MIKSFDDLLELGALARERIPGNSREYGPVFEWAAAPGARETLVKELQCGYCDYVPAGRATKPYNDIKRHLERNHAYQVTSIIIKEAI